MGWGKSFAHRSRMVVLLSALALIITGITYGSIGYQRQLEALTSGSPGSNGVNGTKGDKGDPGTNGIDGRNGTNGINGIDGRNGTNGINGINGIDGRNGTDGATGPQGIQGVAGSSIVGNYSGTSFYYSRGFSLTELTLATVSCSTRNAAGAVLLINTVSAWTDITIRLRCNGTIFHQEYRTNHGNSVYYGVPRIHFPGRAGLHTYAWTFQSAGSYGGWGGGDPAFHNLAFSCIELVSV